MNKLLLLLKHLKILGRGLVRVLIVGISVELLLLDYLLLHLQLLLFVEQQHLVA